MERVESLVIEALRRALAEPSEQRLYKSGKWPGLFPARHGPAAEAAALALRDGLLEVARTETKGKTTIEWARPTPRGVDFLYERESPVMALHALREALRVNQAGIPQWLDQVHAAVRSLEERFVTEARHWQERLEGLERRLEQALERVQKAQPPLAPGVTDAVPWAGDALDYLERRQGGGAEAACPFPELFGALARRHGPLSIGAFHDGLRRLQERHAVRLEPAATVADMSQPEFALPDGGRILYFASR